MKILIVFALLPAFFQTAYAKPNKGFALYLLPPKIRAADLGRLDVTKLKPEGRPFLTGVDYYLYNRDLNEMNIIYTAVDRLKNLRVPASGRPFAVFVDDAPVYAGAFFRGPAPAAFGGVAIDLSTFTENNPVLKFGLDPQSAAADPRSDERLMRAFLEKSKLYEEVWIYGKCRNIEPTYKHVPSFVYTFAVTKIVRGALKAAEVRFEISSYSPSRLDRLLGTKSEPTDESGRRPKFDAEKTLLLKFIRRVGGPDDEVHLHGEEAL
ncbi:MAG: hypothetical protein JSS81_24870 [Acidobacteria bacterium]|nr:hypothetical protein [Acidobacteriota bacterium]